MKKLLVTFTLVVMCAICAVANDVVYLKNGGVVYGTVIETIPNETVKIQAEDGLVYVYQMADVDRIVHDSAYSAPERFYEPNVDDLQPTGDYLKRGFRGIADLGIHVGYEDHEDHVHFNAAMTVGYQATRFLFIGAGVSPTLWVWDWEDNYYYDWDDMRWRRDHDHSSKTAFVLPIYGALRFDFVNAKVSPFLDVRAGYSVTDDCRGAYVYLGAGARIRRFSISGGWTYQDFDSGLREGYDMGFFGIRAGYEF